jgi:hypothetical protein
MRYILLEMKLSIVHSCFPDFRASSDLRGCGGRRNSFLTVAARVLAAVACGGGMAHAVLQDAYIPVAHVDTTLSFEGGMVAGCTFTTTQDVTFRSLGFIDVLTNPASYDYYNVPDVIHGSYQVGIWLNSTQQLLASTVVTPDSPLGQIDAFAYTQFRYAPIPATTIPAGQSFTVAALLPETLLDPWLKSAYPVNLVGITGPANGRYVAGGTLSFPDQIGTFGWAIANASTATVVPEPASTALVILAFGGFATLRRRSARTAR